MELAGNEKRIQALFSELSLADRAGVPNFEHSWKRAETAQPVKSFSGLIAVIGVIAAGVISLSIWTWSNSTADTLAIAPQQIPTSDIARPPQINAVSDPSPARFRRPGQKRPSERHLIREAAVLSRWQSPTQTLMESPAGVALDSLPQLNQSAKDLESFLPKNK